MINYPIAIHKEPKSSYGVTVPDLPGCFSAGRSADDAIANAKEAIELHLEGMIEDGLMVPKSKGIEAYRRQKDYADALMWGLVTIDDSKFGLPDKAVRINITVPERILQSIDKYVEKTGQNRSSFLVHSASAVMQSAVGAVVVDELKSEPSKPKKVTNRGRGGPKQGT